MSNPIYRSAYNAAQIEAAIDKGPRINSAGYWEVWNVANMTYESTGVGAGVTPPTVVTQVSQMTNHGYVYIYTGSEAGYTPGYWYYWSGSAWTAGGAYQVAATDPTLSVAGAAADAKATGELKSAITNVADGDTKLSYYDIAQGYYINYTTGSVNTAANYAVPRPSSSNVRFPIPSGVKRIEFAGLSYPSGSVAGWATYSADSGSTTATFVRGGQTDYIDVQDSDKYFGVTYFSPHAQPIADVDIRFVYTNDHIKIEGLEQAVGGRIVLGSPYPHDMNDVTDVGIYQLYSPTSGRYNNIPAEFLVNSSAILEVIGNIVDGYLYQIMYVYQHTNYADEPCICVRFMYNGMWSDWCNITNPNNILARGTDLNSVTTRGYHFLYTNNRTNPYVNLPTELDGTEATTCLLVEYPYVNPNFISQTLLDRVSLDLYYRESVDGGTTWNDWNTKNETVTINKRHLISIFHTIGVVGDSLASGQGRINDMSHYHDFYDYSWPQCMKRSLNNTVYNFTESGLSTRTWITDADHGWPLASDGNHDCQMYIIGLGANDLSLGSSYLGSSADINLNDYTQNADTYYGNYAGIIQRLRTIEPRSMIFVLTNPVYGSSTLRPQFNAAVKYIATLFDNVFCIELPTSVYDGASFIAQNKVASHYTPAAYQFIAEDIMTRISDVIYQNPEKFFFANLIGTEYVTPTT